jgi:hypothetical protein
MTFIEYDITIWLRSGIFLGSEAFGVKSLRGENARAPATHAAALPSKSTSVTAAATPLALDMGCSPGGGCSLPGSGCSSPGGGCSLPGSG